MKFDFQGIPEDLPEGKYGCRIVGGEVREGEYYLILKYDGPYSTDNHLISVTKKEEGDHSGPQRDAT